MRAAATRTLRMVLTLFGVSVLLAFMLDLIPGDPTLLLLGAGGPAGDRLTDEMIEATREELGFNKPITERYIDWLSGAVRGDLGVSFRTNRPVSEAIVSRIPMTFQLMIMAVTLALLYGITTGTTSAAFRGTGIDRSLTMLSFGLLSVPNFVGAILLVYVFAVKLQWFPAIGFSPLADGLLANLRSLLLPALALAATSGAVYSRLLRAEMSNTLQEDFILTAQSKGLERRVVIFRHALKPSALPLITVVGLSIGNLIGGTVVIETVFGLPGVGRLAIDSINARDYITIQGIVIFITISYVVINYLVDLAYLFLDPRIRDA